MEKDNDGHITTRIDPEIKQAGIDFAKRADRKKAWVFAKAIELGLPEVIKRYSPTRSNDKRAKAA